MAIAAREPLRQALHDALEFRGWRVAESTGGLAELLDVVRRVRPDVCILDRDLPDGGLAAVAALAGCGRRPRVIVVGGESAAERRAARLAGAALCLPVSVEPDDLAAAVQAAAL